ncbi:hypothetical protein [Methylobacterium durans]|uniref:Uncharacterized protein n=1 Tax=Methylobacterium durans TaxID=2202825 RepID=A0A2U8WAL4_9HYPH|nr:hypothetical protein [Methylobacterium durans]AWN43184.1 hypothetical protein DK389_25155 [Methylobacterium durans]
MTRMLTLAALALVCLAAPVFAAEVAEIGDKAVIVPWGAWIVAFGNAAQAIVVPAAVTFLTGLVSTLAWPLRIFLTNALIDRMVRTAIEYALNAVSGAVKDQKLTIPVGSVVIAKAVQRAVDSTPDWIVKAAGGPTGIAERVFRMLHLEDAATKTNTLDPVLPALPTK